MRFKKIIRPAVIGLSTLFAGRAHAEDLLNKTFSSLQSVVDKTSKQENVAIKIPGTNVSADPGHLVLFCKNTGDLGIAPEDCVPIDEAAKPIDPLWMKATITFSKQHYLNYQAEIQPIHRFEVPPFVNCSTDKSGFETCPSLEKFYAEYLKKTGNKRTFPCAHAFSGESVLPQYFQCMSQFSDQFIHEPLFLDRAEAEALNQRVISALSDEISAEGLHVTAFIDNRQPDANARVGILGIVDKNFTSADQITLLPQERVIQVGWEELITWLNDDDTYQGVICHELGHHIGGAPIEDVQLKDSPRFSTEGQADHFAAATCLKRVLQDKPIQVKSEDDKYFYNRCVQAYQNESAARKCFRIGKIGQRLALSGRTWPSEVINKSQISFKFVLGHQGPFEQDAAGSHPGLSCTTAIYASDALCAGNASTCKRNACWYK